MIQVMSGRAALLSSCAVSLLVSGCFDFRFDLGSREFTPASPQCVPSELSEGRVEQVDGGVWPPATAAPFPTARCDAARGECDVRRLYGGGGEFLAGSHCLTNAADETLCFGWPRDYSPDGGVAPTEVVRRDVVDVDVGASMRCFRARDGALRCEGYSDFWGVAPSADTIGAGRWLPEWREADGVDAAGLGGTMLCFVRDGVPLCRGYTGWFPYPGSADDAVGVLDEATAVLGLPTTADVAVGTFSACALSIAGEVHCWGANDAGQLGRRNDLGSATPVAIDVPPLRVLRAGVGAYAGIDFAGGVWLWGTLSLARPDEISAVSGTELYCCADADGALGDGCFAPARVDTLPANIVDIGLGREHACALTDDGRVFCWGGNRSGQLGQGDVRPRAEPTEVPLPELIEQLSVTRLGTCVSARDALWCWGDDDQDNLHVGPADRECEGGYMSGGLFSSTSFFPCVLEPRRVLDYPPPA